MTIGERIKDYASERGIKQAFLAEKIGCDNSKMSKILNGTQEIGADELFLISKALGVPMETFCTD